MRPNAALDGFHSWSSGAHAFSTTPTMPDHSAKAEPSTTLSSASFGGLTFADIIRENRTSNIELRRSPRRPHSLVLRLERRHDWAVIGADAPVGKRQHVGL